MKKIKVFQVILVLALVGLMFPISFCKKETQTVTLHDTTIKTVHDTSYIHIIDTLNIHDTITVNIHDTLRGKAISGSVTYPNNTNTQIPAKGAVIYLRQGSATGPLGAVTFSDSLGNYTIPYLLPGTYFISGKYNTNNQNYRAINGISFATNPGYTVTLGSTNLVQNMTMVTILATGTAKLTITAADTLVDPTLKYLTVEIHSGVTFSLEHLDSNYVGMNLGGSFPQTGDPSGGFKIVSFVFDEANPANTYFKAYVLTHTVNTDNIARDTARGGCVDNCFNHDTIKDPNTGAATVLAQTDTAYYYCTPGQVVKYGSGYLVHGTFAPVWKHQGGEIVSPKVTACTPDTVMGYNGQYGWNTRIAVPTDFYFEYQGAKKLYNATGTTFNWYFEFEGQLIFRRSTFYMKAGMGDVVTVNPHIELKGVNNKDY